MAKTYVYELTKEVGKVNENSTLEIGHFVVDGKVNADKVYLTTKFTRRNGSEDSSHTAVCSVADAKAIGELLMKVESTK